VCCCTWLATSCCITLWYSSHCGNNRGLNVCNGLCAAETGFWVWLKGGGIVELVIVTKVVGAVVELEQLGENCCSRSYSSDRSNSTSC
jgi:hypothetical protein